MTQEPPREAPRRATEHAPSLVIVNTGDGKGKTTAAMGILVRAIARGWKTCVIQFVKSDEWKVGEEKVGKELGAEWWSLGDGFTWDSEDMDRSEALGREAWAAAKQKIASGDYDLVLLDEVTYPINWGWIELDDVIAAIESRPSHVNIVLTGRDAPERLVEAADTVTEMRHVKHAFDKGIVARKGIDY